MEQKQTCIRFEHPCGALSSSQWRQGLLPSHAAVLEDVSVFQSSTALSLTAMTPEASERLREGALPLMRAVSSLAGRTLSVEMPEFTPSVAVTGYRWMYQIPCIAVARSGDEWGPWQEAQPTQEIAEKLRSRIANDMGKQLVAWGLSVPDLGIELITAGGPMVLKSAVAQGPKPTSAMGRKCVMFSSTARIEGAFWAGLLQATGHGRIYRYGYHEQN